MINDCLAREEVRDPSRDYWFIKDPSFRLRSRASDIAVAVRKDLPATGRKTWGDL